MFGLLLLVGVGIYYLVKDTNANNERYRQREAASLTLIQPAQLLLNNVRLGQSYGTWKVAGTVQNKSQYSLNQFSLRVTVRDCPTNPCVTIGEDEVLINVRVPPGQLRAFDGNVYLSNLPTAQRMTWTYGLASVKADVP